MFRKVVCLLLAVFLAVAGTAHIGDIHSYGINQRKIHEVLNFAVDQYNAQSDSKYNSQVIKVIKVDVQKYPCLQYVFTVIMAKTFYKDVNTEYQCAATVDPITAHPYKCKLVVQKQPWYDHMKLVGNTC